MSISTRCDTVTLPVNNISYCACSCDMEKTGENPNILIKN